MMKAMALELSGHRIRVNTVNPACVATPMILNDPTYRLFRPDLERPTIDDALERFASVHLLPIPFVDPVDVSNAVLWLASDEARYVTGVALPVDAGCLVR